MHLSIILSIDTADTGDALASLQRVLPPQPPAIYCLCADEAQASRVREAWESRTKSRMKGTFTRRQFSSAGQLAQHCLSRDASPDYVLFLSSQVRLQGDALETLMQRLATDDQVAGANPLLGAGWLPGAETRIAFLGLAFDLQKKLHYLHEGMAVANPLAQKERFFQMAHPGCLMLRGEDLKACGPWREDLGFLAFPAFCLQMLKLRPRGFACVPEARGYLGDKWDSWSFCGAWDSILQRGRLDPGNIRADYPDFCLDDGLAYDVDSWLAEGPDQIPDESEVPAVRSWQQWRYHPNPATLLALLASLAPEERPQGVALARNRPASLPQTLQYYRVQAAKIKELAEGSQIPVAAQIDAWQRRIRRFHYGELKPGMELLRKAGIYNCALDTCPAVFDAWVELGERFAKLDMGASWPELAVVMPVWNPRPEFLRQAIESVVAQTYTRWQLSIADDASTRSDIRPLLEHFAREDARIRVTFREENGHICRATNTALEMVAAPFTAFLDHDDLLSPHALGEVARAIAQKPHLGFIYTDDDRINEDNVRRSPVFRPDFDCDLFHTGHLSTYRTDLLRELGGLRLGTEGSQDQDLRLRVTERLDQDRIAHIPHILYHWRVHEDSTASSLLAKPYVVEVGRKVYLDAAARQGRKAEWVDKEAPRLFRFLYYPRERCRCAVIFLVDDVAPSPRLLAEARALKAHADVDFYAQPVRADAPRIDGMTPLPWVGGGLARAYNEAAAAVDGDVVLFLSASLEPAGECRLEQLVELALAPHIAMAGGNLWCHDILAHGGWYPDADGVPFLLLQGMAREEVKNSAWGQMCLPRHVLGVPWSCLAMRKSVCPQGQFLDEDYGSMAPVAFALDAMNQNKFVAMNPWVNWQVRKMPPAPSASAMKFLVERRGGAIAACGLRNPHLRAAPDRDWTLIFQ